MYSADEFRKLRIAGLRKQEEEHIEQTYQLKSRQAKAKAEAIERARAQFPGIMAKARLAAQGGASEYIEHDTFSSDYEKEIERLAKEAGFGFVKNGAWLGQPEEYVSWFVISW